MYYIEFGYKTSTGFVRNIFEPLDNEISKKIEQIRAQRDNKALFYSVLQRSNKEDVSKSSLWGPIYFDIDGDLADEHGFEICKTAVISLYEYLLNDLFIKKNEIQLFFSGAKGFHIIVPGTVVKIKPSNQLNIQLKQFVEYVSKQIEHGELLDRRIYDNRRLIRMPNSINTKTGCHKIQLSIEEIRTYNLEGIKTLAQATRTGCPTSILANEQAAVAFQNTLNKFSTANIKSRKKINLSIKNNEAPMPLCFEEIISRPISQGGRNNVLIMISSIMVQHGYSLDTAYPILEIWNNNNPEPLPDSELRRTFISARKMAAEGKGFGCSAIRSSDLINVQICKQCPIFTKQNSYTKDGYLSGTRNDRRKRSNGSRKNYLDTRAVG